MSQIKILKQDIINSLKTNLNTNNINELIKELKMKTLLNFTIEISQQKYMWYINPLKSSFVANITISDHNFKNSFMQGFGRNEFEALLTALLNFIELLLQEEKFINAIKESLKIFLKLVSTQNLIIIIDKL